MRQKCPKEPVNLSAFNGGISNLFSEMIADKRRRDGEGGFDGMAVAGATEFFGGEEGELEPEHSCAAT
jgi:hypothetical protein